MFNIFSFGVRVGLINTFFIDIDLDRKYITKKNKNIQQMK